MKLLRLLTFAAVLFTFASCQKEISWDTNPPTGGGGTGGGGTGGGGTGGGTGTLLKKIVSVTNSDTMTTYYTHDSQNRIETELMEGKVAGNYYKSFKRFIRDGNDRIITVKQKIEQAGMPSADTAVQTFYYPNSTTKEFTRSIMVMELMGLTNYDSTVYTYSGGNMTKTEGYMASYMLGIQIAPYSQMNKFENTFDASGSITKMMAYSAPPGTPGQPIELLATYTHTYGTNNIPNHYTTNAAQNYILGGNASKSTKELQKTVIVSPSVPQANMTMNYTYTLGANGKVATAKLTEVPVSGPTEVTNYTYYY